jgi:hypothetical protein
MTAAVQQLLNTFDSLSDAEKKDAVTELLRRVRQFELGDVPEEALLAAADELFRELDTREAADARP